jgi:Domain of unknown function (DUF5710)
MRIANPLNARYIAESRAVAHRLGRQGMPRIDLNVPFHEKDEAKALGAKWDPQRRIWYAPGNLDSARLRKWLPDTSPNVRAASYFLVQGTRDCWRCALHTRVFGILLPAGYEALEVDDDPANDHWRAADEPTMLSYITFLADPIPARLRHLASRYRTDYSQTTHSFYWMNHCDRCGIKLGDFETVEESGAALNPTTPEDAARVYLHEILEPLLAACGSYTYGLDLFSYMRRCPAPYS